MASYGNSFTFTLHSREWRIRAANFIVRCVNAYSRTAPGRGSQLAPRQDVLQATIRSTKWRENDGTLLPAA
jgi:hypothetical protein